MRGDGPLRYPGAKANLARLIARFIERHRLVGLPIVEPFAGSAAVSRVLIEGKLAPAADVWELDPGAYSFWDAALNRPSELKRLISDSPVTLSEFDRHTQVVRELSGKPEDTLQSGFSFLFLNRTSYSGIVGAGPIGGRQQSSGYTIDCRYNPTRLLEQIDKVAQLRGRLRVHFGDGIAAIGNTEAFLYVDPPYFSNGKKFYRKYFSTFDHYRLRKALSLADGRWLLSYDYDRKVEYLYRRFPMADVELYHSARSAGAKRELLVSPLGFSDVVDTSAQVRLYA